MDSISISASAVVFGVVLGSILLVFNAIPTEEDYCPWPFTELWSMWEVRQAHRKRIRRKAMLLILVSLLCLFLGQRAPF